MRHLKMWQKLALMGALFMVPFAGVTYKMTSSINALGLDTARLEVRGLEYVAPALTLVKDLQLHRGMSSAWSNGGATFRDLLVKTRADIERDLKALDVVDARLDPLLHTSERWAEVRAACASLMSAAPTLSDDDRFARHSSLIADVVALIAEVGQASRLTLDPDIEHKLLIDVLLFEGPGLTEALARARGFGIGVAASKATSDDQFERLNRESVLVEFLGARLDESMAKAVESNEGLRVQLEAGAAAATDAVLQATAEVGKLARGGNATTVPAEYFATLTRGIDSIVALSAQITTALDRGLSVRIAALRRDVLQTLGWAALGLGIVCLIGLWIMRDITVTLAHVVEVANRIAIGDLTMPPAETRRDEIGVLANAFGRMVAALHDTVGVAERIASGDLAVTVTHRSNRDALGHALTNMVGRLSTLMGEIQRSGIQVNTSVNQIAATTMEIRATSTEISATSKELVRTMSEVSGVAEQSASLAGSGQAGLVRMEATMRRVMEAAGSINAKLAVLSEKAGGITQVVTTISKVADQTNLLSLNAAIEAEKAGEYGRGFAVVATEIRRLADQTAVATYDIEQTVKEIQSAVVAGVMGMDKFSEEVRRGVQEVEKVGDQLSQIILHVQALPPRFEAVNEGMQAQATGAEQISQALSLLGETVHETVASLRQSHNVIDGLNPAAGPGSGAPRLPAAA